jgi:5-methylthioadenosine/S-adenosylhomocysteine deaminase
MPPQPVDRILTNGTVLTMNPAFDVYSPGAVAIRGTQIVAVGSAVEVAEAYEAEDVLDCQQLVILPGLINAHTHAPMSLLRGLADDLRLDVWLLGYMMPVEREFVSPEFVRLGTRLACGEMIRSGITCFADMYYYEEYVAAAAVDCGMRALCGETVLKFPTPDAYSFEASLRRCRDFVEHWLGHGLITPAVSPHAAYTSTPEILQACAEMAQTYNVPLKTHVAETAQEVEDNIHDHGMRVVPWIQQHGILDTQLIAAHCVHINEEEQQLLHRAGAGIVHNPSSNLKLASGIAPVRQMLEVGLDVGIGTDGAASNNDLDMVEEMRLAAFLAKGDSGDPTALPARDALALATSQGARALHLGVQIGSLEPGKKADMIVMDLGDLHSTPRFVRDPAGIYAQIVYAGKSTDVVHTMVNGRWLMRDRELLTLDADEILAEAREVAKRIDQFLAEREQSPLRKLLVIGDVKQEESFEVQVKGRLGPDSLNQVKRALAHPEVSVVKQSHYRQYDTYLFFDSADPDSERLRFREDQIVNERGEVVDARNRLTLIGPSSEREFPGAVMLSRSRYIAPADKSLRFYQEYFQPSSTRQVDKERHRWRIRYRNTDFAINLDRLTQPQMPCCFLEIKSRTWSQRDAQRKADLIIELIALFDQIDRVETIPDGYVDLQPQP